MSELAEISIRSAVAKDVERIAEIMHGEPGPELVGVVGNRERASAFGRGLVRLERIPNAARPAVVAERDDLVVGVLQYTLSRSHSAVDLQRVLLALRVGGPIRTLRSLPRVRARGRVDLSPPPGAFYIAELHVDPASRGSGVGEQLLDWADERARGLGIGHMALVTHSTNRARHLYERKGYVVTASRFDERYERYTGVPGRLLMEKHLP
jgi:ribosomal protein S18 acetylase RimI-like enzyme